MTQTETLDQALSDGGLVLTATDRLARDLRLTYALSRREAGMAAWDVPAIESLRSYLDKQWRASWPEKQMLHPAQVLALWRSAIDASGDSAKVISGTALARAAKAAGALVLRHEIQPARRADYPTPEQEAFAGWNAHVDKLMADRGWTTRDHLAREMTRRLVEGCWTAPPKVALAGYWDFETSSQPFFKALAAAGTVISHLELPCPVPSADRNLVRFETADEQIEAVAYRIKELLDRHADDPDSAPRIGVLVPDLERARGRIENTFREILAPYLNLPESAGLPAPWRFARGRPLADQPLIASALAISELKSRANPVEAASRLILDKQLWFREAGGCRADLDLWLRDRGGRTVSLSALAHGALSVSTCSRIAGDLTALDDAISQMPSLALPSAWVDHFARRLTLVGWPGSVEDSSVGHQALERWHEAMRELAAMDVQIGQIDASGAALWLREITSTRPFEPRVNYREPVAILEYEDAAGLSFDHLYVLDLSSHVLPRPSVPTPFIPRDAQIAAGVPGVTPESALEHARALLMHIERLSPRVTYCCPKLDTHGAMVLPCTLLSGWPKDSAAGAPADCSVARKIAAAGKATVVPEQDEVSPVRAEDLPHVRGGTGLYTNFVDSPFYAYMRNRLQVREFPQIRSGLGADLQGKLVHATLERFWRSVRNRAGLLALGPDALRSVVEGCVEEAAQHKGLFVAEAWGRRLVALERARVAALVVQWLTFESQRRDDFEVLFVEQWVEVEIHGLKQRICIDRVDRITLPDGRNVHLIIDYKTGQTDGYAGWRPESLSAPQLPIYASMGVLEGIGLPGCDGIAHALVSSKGMRFEVLSSFGSKLHAMKDGTLGAAVAAWDQTKAAWRAALEDIAKRFLAGEAWIEAEGSKSWLNEELNQLVRAHDGAGVAP